MTQEPEKKPSSSPEKRFVQRSLGVIARWSPLGGTSFAFGSFLLKQEWATALMLFPVTAVSGVWAAYSKNFIERLSEIYGERGKKDAEGFVENMDRANQALNQKLNWQALGFDVKYLQCQMWDCHEDYAVGLREDENLPVNNPLLREVFVPLELSSDSIASGYEFRDRDESCQQIQIWELLERVKQDNRLRQIAIRAWGGYGKSTLLKHLTYIYSTGEYNKGDFRKYKVPKFVPFLLYLAGCWKEIAKENPPDLPELLTNFHIGRLSKIKELETVPSNWALNLLRRGDALVMFDGFDEVPPVQRAKVSEWLSAEMQKYREAVFIVTSRPTAFREDYVARKPTARFWIQDFNQEQRKQFVEQWYLCQERYARGGRNTPDVEAKAKERAKSLLEQIQARPELNDIAGNVLLLNMMARFHRDKHGSELPQRKAELYQDICELQLGRRPKAKGIDYLLLNSINDRQKVLQFVALEMMKWAVSDKENLGGFRQIQHDDLLQLIKIALTKIDGDVDSQEFLGQIEQVSELLVKRDGSFYQFSHLSFQEFLAASEIVRLQQESLLYEHLSLSAWKDTILFYASLVNPTKLLQEAINCNEIDLAYLIYRQTDKQLNLSLMDEHRLYVKSIDETLKRLGEKFNKNNDKLLQRLNAVRYFMLETYLQSKQWQKADYETYRLMITSVGKDEGQGFSEDDLRNFPCDELLEIDRLWVNYSKEHGFDFGFSVQKKIYIECGGKIDFSIPTDDVWRVFCHRTAWQSNGEWVDYPQPFFEDDFMGKNGHLPRWGSVPSKGGKGIRYYLFSRMENCEL